MEYGHIILASRDRVIRGLQEVRFGKRDVYSKVRLDEAISYLKIHSPAIGAWIRHGEPPMYVVECSICGQKFFYNAFMNFPNFCSNCGAKMESWMVDNQAEG